MKQILFLTVVFVAGFMHGQVVGQKNEETVFTAEEFAKREVGNGPDAAERSFWIRIRKDLPPYKFRIIPDASLHDFPPNGKRHHVGTIEVFTGKPLRLVQTIPVSTRTSADMLTRFFAVSDIDMDGFADIAVTDDWGAKWSRQRFWVYNKDRGRFITTPLTNEIFRFMHNGIDLHPESREIDVNHMPTIGVGGLTKETYKIRGGRLIFVKLETIRNTAKGPRTFVEKRVNGKLRTVAIKKDRET
ncbi:MAG: hypothetical protein ABI878_13630 [Acidobacteriota bacterium]